MSGTSGSCHVQNIRNNKDKAAGKDDDKKGLIVNDPDDYLDETILDAEEFFAGARLERESKEVFW